jgi:hypothetical protein
MHKNNVPVCSFSFFVDATKKEKRTKRKKMQMATAK